jgi:hypothetical protein
LSKTCLTAAFSTRGGASQSSRGGAVRGDAMCRTDPRAGASCERSAIAGRPCARRRTKVGQARWPGSATPRAAAPPGATPASVRGTAKHWDRDPRRRLRRSHADGPPRSDIQTVEGRDCLVRAVVFRSRAARISAMATFPESGNVRLQLRGLGCDLGHRVAARHGASVLASPSWAFPPLTWAARHAACGPLCIRMPRI